MVATQDELLSALIDFQFSDGGKASYEVIRRYADNNDAFAVRGLASLYWNGQYVSQNREYAKSLYLKAAALGDAQAMIHIAEQARLSKNYEQAFKYFKMAANNGSLEASVEVAECYYYGRGVEKNYNEALVWAKKPGLLNPFPWWNINKINKREEKDWARRTALKHKLYIRYALWQLKRFFARLLKKD